MVGQRTVGRGEYRGVQLVGERTVGRGLNSW